jgi:hypothetical protein
MRRHFPSAWVLVPALNTTAVAVQSTLEVVQAARVVAVLGLMCGNSLCDGSEKKKREGGGVVQTRAYLVGDPAAVYIPRVSYDLLQKSLPDATASHQHARARYPYEMRGVTELCVVRVEQISKEGKG